MKNIDALHLDQLTLDLEINQSQVPTCTLHTCHDTEYYPIYHQSLYNTIFTIVDLETTGSNPLTDHITEIAAVKVQQGKILEQFHTLINPQYPIPQRITQLTGINYFMVRDAPTLAHVLPDFLSFFQGSVPVAHNARFDFGFLHYQANLLDLSWNHYPPLCTLQLARKILSHDEVPSYSLKILSNHFSTHNTPTHRAMADVLTTIEVLHALLERIGNTTQTYSQLITFMQSK